MVSTCDRPAKAAELAITSSSAVSAGSDLNTSSYDSKTDSSSTEILKSFNTAGPNGGSLESLPAMTAHVLSVGFTRFPLLKYRQIGSRGLGETADGCARPRPSPNAGTIHVHRRAPRHRSGRRVRVFGVFPGTTCALGGAHGGTTCRADSLRWRWPVRRLGPARRRIRRTWRPGPPSRRLMGREKCGLNLCQGTADQLAGRR